MIVIANQQKWWIVNSFLILYSWWQRCHTLITGKHPFPHSFVILPVLLSTHWNIDSQSYQGNTILNTLWNSVSRQHPIASRCYVLEAVRQYYTFICCWSGSVNMNHFARLVITSHLIIIYLTAVIHASPILQPERGLVDRCSGDPNIFALTWISAFP